VQKKEKFLPWRGKATVRPRRQGRRGVAFTGTEWKPLTEEAGGSGAEFGQEGIGIYFFEKKRETAGNGS